MEDRIEQMERWNEPFTNGTSELERTLKIVMEHPVETAIGGAALYLGGRLVLLWSGKQLDNIMKNGYALKIGLFSFGKSKDIFRDEEECG